MLERLAGFCAFSGSAALARALLPSTDLLLAEELLGQTREARRLLDIRSETTIGGAHDIRPLVDAAARAVILEPAQLLEVKHTLVAGREIARTFERLAEQYPLLSQVALRTPPPSGLIDVISKVISERGEIHDNASPRLAEVRRAMRIVHERLLARMQSMLSDPKVAPYLQDNLITTRDGRYVIPLNADFKGKVKSIVHDQSASGATLFVEPLGVVDLNNQHRQLQLDERDEERRILAALSMTIGQQRLSIELMVDSLAELDLAFARAKYAEHISASEPRLLRFENRPASSLPAGSRHPGSVLRIQGARHPLLNPEKVVPTDLLLDDQTYALIITGPNTGGKTVSLKTAGLMVAMAQSGLHIPADPGAELTLFENVFADIGDEQSIEQSLSTFSSHITNIIRILRQATRRSLVLLDELGSGTDPQEGAALAMAIVTYLLDQGVTTLVATHYPELKAFAHARSGVVNASMEFDIETLRPTYHLIIGLPGSSNALTIASRLGLGAQIIEMARQGVSAEELKAEDLLAEIHQQRDQMRKARAAAEVARIEAEHARRQLQQRLEKIEDERRGILEKARKDAEKQIAGLEEEMRDLRRRLALARQPLEVVEEVAQEVEALADTVAEPVERAAVTTGTGGSPAQRAIRLGDRVRLRSLGSTGVVFSLGEEEAEVQLGVLRIRTRRSELELVGPAAEAPAAPTGAAAAPEPARRKGKSPLQALQSPGVELDLRGKTVDEALEALEGYLDNAYLANLPWVRIIHGKGTGKLRDAVRQALKANPHVTSFELGGEGEGGDGVTVAKFG